MTTFAQLVRDAQFRNAVIADYRGLLAEAMLTRIVAFSGEPIFGRFVRELAELTEMSEPEAAAELLDVSRAIYGGALAAADVTDAADTHPVTAGVQEREESVTPEPEEQTGEAVSNVARGRHLKLPTSEAA